MSWHPATGTGSPWATAWCAMARPPRAEVAEPYNVTATASVPTDAGTAPSLLQTAGLGTDWAAMPFDVPATAPRHAHRSGLLCKNRRFAARHVHASGMLTLLVIVIYADHARDAEPTICVRTGFSVTDRGAAGDLGSYLFGLKYISSTLQRPIDTARARFPLQTASRRNALVTLIIYWSMATVFDDPAYSTYIQKRLMPTTQSTLY